MTMYPPPGPQTPYNGMPQQPTSAPYGQPVPQSMPASQPTPYGQPAPRPMYGQAAQLQQMSYPQPQQPTAPADPVLAALQPHSQLLARGGYFPKNVYIGMEPCYLSWGNDDVLRILQPERQGMMPVREVPLPAIKSVRWEKGCLLITTNGFGRITVAPDAELHRSQQINGMVGALSAPVGIYHLAKEQGSSSNPWMQAFRARGITARGPFALQWWTIPVMIAIFAAVCLFVYAIGG